MTTPARRTALDSRAIVLVLGCCLVWGMGQIAIMAALLGGLPPLLQAGLHLQAQAFDPATPAHVVADQQHHGLGSSRLCSTAS